MRIFTSTSEAGDSDANPFVGQTEKDFNVSSPVSVSDAEDLQRRKLNQANTFNALQIV